VSAGSCARSSTRRSCSLRAKMGKCTGTALTSSRVGCASSPSSGFKLCRSSSTVIKFKSGLSTPALGIELEYRTRAAKDLGAVTDFASATQACRGSAGTDRWPLGGTCRPGHGLAMARPGRLRLSWPHLPVARPGQAGLRRPRPGQAGLGAGAMAGAQAGTGTQAGWPVSASGLASGWPGLGSSLTLNFRRCLVRVCAS
jgi:hypothetical protein